MDVALKLKDDEDDEDDDDFDIYRLLAAVSL